MTPQEQQNERTVLGSMLLSDEGFEVGSTLSPADFALDSHRRIFSRMLAMKSAGLAVDVQTLSAELDRLKEMPSVGGIGYVLDLTDGVPRNYAPRSYVAILRKKSQTRAFGNNLLAAINRLRDGEELEDVVAFVQGEAITSQLAASDDRPQPIREWVMPTMRELHEERSHSGSVLGIPSGVEDLDRVTTGWRPGELTYVGAAPGRGKTAFLLQSVYAAATSGYGCGLISLEMRKEELMRRLCVMHGRTTAAKMRDPRLMNDAEWRSAEQTMLSLGDLPIWGTDVSGLSPAKIARAARQMYAEGARCLFIDFVQIVREDGKDRREAINRVSATLRDTAKALRIPFVVASQLARRDADENRRPTMHDLRESGNLEQDAHRVLLIYRPKDKSTGEYTGDDLIIVGKQRNGVEGAIEVTYNAQALRFHRRGPRMAERAA